MMKTKEVLLVGILLMLVMGISLAANMWPFNKASGDVLTADDWNEAVRVTGMAVAQKQTGDIITADDWNALAGCLDDNDGSGCDINFEDYKNY
jgi:hypothetical protein